jgi:ATP-dependent DNA helicase RecG
LAELDLDQRREGDVLGASQSGGRSGLRHLRVLRDEELIKSARGEARRLVDADPDLSNAPELRAELEALVGDDQTEFLERG